MIRDERALRLTDFEVHPIQRTMPMPKRAAAIASVGSAFPASSYSQEEIVTLLGLENRVVKKLLRSPHIQRRHIYLPQKDDRTGRVLPESAADLHAKFLKGALDIASPPFLKTNGDLSLSTPAVRCAIRSA